MQKQDNFYITTPIYYGNGLPHVGHFYSSIIANTIYKYNKISGVDSRFTTGIDENSQKSVLKAQELGLSIEEYTDNMAVEHKKVWDFFNIDYTDFIRTTEDRHHKLVSEVLQHCFDKGDIYEGEYEGMYCVGCEAFKKEEDLVFLNKEQNVTFPISDKVKVNDNIIKVCPDHLKTPDQIKEKNYFFKLTRYQTWIEEFYKANPDFVNPNFRYNEVKAFVGRGLEDFSISRETNTFGIPLPFDDSQVTYVWFDALFNYYTSIVNEKEFFPTDVHVIGKDIARFHAIFWPAMLASCLDLGEERDGILHFKESDLEQLPKQILTGGFFTVDGHKMSKTIGNVIEPVEYSKKYSKELLTLYMLSAFPIGNDGDYDRKDAILNFNAKLANNFGNLVNRVVVLTLKLELENGLLGKIDSGIDEKLNKFVKEFDSYMNEYNLKDSLDCTFRFLDDLNKYVDDTQPWTLIKDEEKREEVINIFYTIAESLRQVGMNLYPFFPEKMGEMFEKIGLENYVEELEDGKLNELRKKEEVFNIKEKGEPLFARFDLD